MEREDVIVRLSQAGNHHRVIQMLEGVPPGRMSPEEGLALARACVLHSGRSASSQRGPLLIRALEGLDAAAEICGGREQWWTLRARALSGLERAGEAELCRRQGERTLRPEMLGERTFPGGRMMRYPPALEGYIMNHMAQFFQGRSDTLGAIKGGSDVFVPIFTSPDCQGRWLNTFTLGLGAVPLPVPCGVNACPRVELLGRIPLSDEWDETQSRMLKLPRIVGEQQRRHKRWIAPGMVIHLDTGGPFSWGVVEPLEGWPPEVSVCPLPGGDRVELYEVVYLYDEEARWCTTDARVEELCRKLRALPLSGDPRRPCLVSGVMSREEEARVHMKVTILFSQKKYEEGLRLMERVPREQRPREYAAMMLLWRLLEVLNRPVMPDRGAEMEGLLAEVRETEHMDQADSTWRTMMSIALYGLGRYGECLGELEICRQLGFWEGLHQSMWKDCLRKLGIPVPWHRGGGEEW